MKKGYFGKWFCGGERIYASMRRDRVFVENTYSYAFFCAAHRWTAIGVGAVRHHTAIGALATDIGPIAPDPSDFQLRGLKTSLLSAN